MIASVKSYIIPLLIGLSLFSFCGKKAGPEHDPERMLRRVWRAKRVYEQNNQEYMVVIYFNPGGYGTYTWREDLYIERIIDPAQTVEEKGDRELQDDTTLLLTPDEGEQAVIPFQWQGGDRFFFYQG
ncbi:hypothetical protein ACFLT7_06355 [candidate division KSB1 bacterium]